MTNDGDALFRALCELSADDTPRLVYADWLEENGQPERAEFIRLQCEAWNLSPAYPTINEARTRASALAREFGDAWYDELPALGGVTWSGLFVRGFIDSVRAAGDDAETRTRLKAVFAAAPLRRLIVTPLDQTQLSGVLALPELGRLNTLKLWAYSSDGQECRYTDENYQLLVEAERRFPHVAFEYARRGR